MNSPITEPTEPAHATRAVTPARLLVLAALLLLAVSLPGGEPVRIALSVATGALLLRLWPGGDMLRLAQAEERYRLLTENAPIGIFRCDREGWVSYVNSRGYEIVGITADHLDQGRGWARYIHDDDRDRVLAVWANAGADPRPFELRYRFVRPSGEVRSVLQKAVPIRNRRGAVIGFQGTTADVTEREAAELALRASEQRLRDVFDTVGLMAAITTVDGSIAYINEAFANTAGRHAPELIGADWIETFSADKDDARVVEHFFSELRAGRIVRHDENWIDTARGPRLISWSNTILRNGDGSVYGASSIGHDVTEQRSAEEGLRASEERFRMLSTHAPVGIFQTDVDGECVYVNERWSRLTGLTLSDAVGRGWRRRCIPTTSMRWRPSGFAALRWGSRLRWTSATCGPTAASSGRAPRRCRCATRPAASADTSAPSATSPSGGWPSRRCCIPSGGCAPSPTTWATSSSCTAWTTGCSG